MRSTATASCCIDAFERTTTTTNPRNETSTMGLDVLNRVVWKSSPVPNDTTRFRYDSLNNPVQVTDARGQTYTTHYNVLGWARRQVDPGSRVDSVECDAAGNVVRTRTRAGRVVTFVYDSLNRMTKKTGASGDEITYGYDPAGRWASARSVSRGTLVSTDTIFTDSAGRTTREQTVRAGTGGWYVPSSFNTLQVRRTFVGAYKLNQGTSQSAVWFVEDALRRLSAIQLPSGQTSFGYTAEQLLDSIALPSGLSERFTYTSSHALARRRYSVPAVQLLLGRGYGTDSLARLVERSRDTATKLFQTFAYDSVGRLAKWQKKTLTGNPNCVNDPSGFGYTCSAGVGAQITQSVTPAYDKVDNPTDLGASVSTGNRLTAFNGVSGMTYDDDGNLLSKGTDTYDWDDFGQLKAVYRNGALRASFDYDGFGRRIRKTSSTSAVQYVWDGDQIILEADASGNTLQSYTYYPGIDALHSVTAGGQTYYASIEPTGEINGLIRGSDNAVVAEYAYTPWGELETDSQTVNGQRVNSLRWKGLVYDHETGLYAMRARFYDPQLRRFISEDPIGLAGGINQYAFTGGDPVNGRDPSGLDPINNGFNQCWKLDYAYTNATPEPILYYVQVECPSSPLPSAGSGFGNQGQPSGARGQTTGGGSIDAAIAGSLYSSAKAWIRDWRHPPDKIRQLANPSGKRGRLTRIGFQIVRALRADPTQEILPPTPPASATQPARATLPAAKGVTIRYLPAILLPLYYYDMYQDYQAMTRGTWQNCMASPLCA